jgi:hypothetical protein
MYCFQHEDKGAVHPADIPVPGHRKGASIATDLKVPTVGLREVERNLQGLKMDIPPLQRGEVPLHLHQHTVVVPKNINSPLRHVVRAVVCYSQHNVMRGDYSLSRDHVFVCLVR